MRYLVLMIVALALIGCSQEPRIATVDGQAVTQAEFEAYLKFKRLAVKDEARQAKLLDQYLERNALAAAIEKTDVLNKALVRAELEAFRKEMLISRYFEAYLKDKVGADAVQNYYNTHADQYEEKQVQVAHILIRANPKMSETERKAKLTTAQEAYSMLGKGDAFDEVAAKYSEDKVSAKRGGDLGWISPGSIDRAFSKLAFELEEGEISEPFETPFGYHVLKVLAAPRVIKKSFEAVAGDIRFRLRNEAKRTELDRLIGSVKVEQEE